jgi:hypothetical protein
MQQQPLFGMSWSKAVSDRVKKKKTTPILFGYVVAQWLDCLTL